LAWYFPPEQLVASDCVDFDVINAALQGVHSEVSGELNEQNWAASSLTNTWGTSGSPPSLLAVEPGFAIVAHHVDEDTDPFGGPLFELQKSTSWRPVDRAEITFDGFGGMVHIVASWQCRHSSLTSRTNGFMYCFEIDGNPVPDAMIGSGDLTNDLVQSGIVFTGTITTNDYATGPGFAAAHIGYSLELMTHLAPGRHVIRLVSRALETDTGTSVVHSVGTVELYALELWDH
jgi:hypothetical protein